MKAGDVIFQLDNVRVVYNDERNRSIERKEVFLDKESGKVDTKWVWKGYAGTLQGAIKTILAREWLIDEDTIRSVEDFGVQVEKIYTKIEMLLKEEAS